MKTFYYLSLITGLLFCGNAYSQNSSTTTYNGTTEATSVSKQNSKGGLDTHIGIPDKPQKSQPSGTTNQPTIYKPNKVEMAPKANNQPVMAPKTNNQPTIYRKSGTASPQ